MWKNIESAPKDAIFGLTEAYKNDPNPLKVNLGVGVYKDDNGNTPVLDCVKAAEKMLLTKENSKSYLPISGDVTYGKCVQELIFGEDSEVITSQRAATVHGPGGTGALRVGADLLKKFKPDAKIWISTPTWANHKGIFGAAGFELVDYPYYNQDTKSIDFDQMLNCLKKIPAGDVVLFHACCHNPSGVDPTSEQWQAIVKAAADQGWIPFLDFAYQGFSSGVEADRYPVELMAEARTDFLVASSFSKNFGLYNERTGALTVTCPSAEEASVAMSHLKATVRVNFSNPPAHGGLTAATILRDQQLKTQWLEELASMRDRITSMRAQLVDGLSERGVNQDFSFIKEQKGMFSFSGLSDAVVSWLQEHKSIYIVGGGRINVAGMTSANIDYICDSIAEALEAKPN